MSDAIKWDGYSCCGQHGYADIPVSEGRVLKVQQVEGGYVAMLIRDGVLDTSGPQGGLWRELDETSALALIGDLGGEVTA